MFIVYWLCAHFETACDLALGELVFGFCFGWRKRTLMLGQIKLSFPTHQFQFTSMIVLVSQHGYGYEYRFSKYLGMKFEKKISVVFVRRVVVSLCLELSFNVL